MNEPKLFTDGAAYERLMGRWSRPVGEQFIDWLGLPKELKWLDVGCGNGAFTETMIARCAPAEVMGVDPSEGQLAYARSRPQAKQAEFRVAGAQDLPFADDSYNVATMALVISFVPDPAKGVAEMKRVVRPGGTVAAYMWDLPGNGIPLAALLAAMQSLGVPTNSPNPEISRLESLRNLWEKTGLRDVDTRVIRIPAVYPSFDDFWEANTVDNGPAGKALHAQPPEMQEKVRSRLREMLKADANGRITVESITNAVKGRVA
jgi:ubiquinone/menaquinone biosynthesis C-methylase UbiE